MYFRTFSIGQRSFLTWNSIMILHIRPGAAWQQPLGFLSSSQSSSSQDTDNLQEAKAHRFCLWLKTPPKYSNILFLMDYLVNIKAWFTSSKWFPSHASFLLPTSYPEVLKQGWLTFLFPSLLENKILGLYVNNSNNLLLLWLFFYHYMKM